MTMGLSIVTVEPGSGPRGTWKSVGQHVSHWGYKAFSRVQAALAAAEGIALHEMDGYAGYIDESGRFLPLDLNALPDQSSARRWETVSTPLLPLLHYPDDEPDSNRQYITAQQAAQILPRLREIDQGTDWDQVAGTHRSTSDAMAELIALLDDSARNGWTVVLMY